MRSLFAILILVVVTSVVHAVKPKDCGSKATSLKITISGCSEADSVCPLVQGQNVTLTVEFTARKFLLTTKRACIFFLSQRLTISNSCHVAMEITSATIQLAGVIGVVKIPFPLNPSEACGNWGLKCPAAAGSTQTLQVQLPIQKSYPKIKVGVMMQLVSGKEKLICMSFPAQIKAA